MLLRCNGGKPKRKISVSIISFFLNTNGGVLSKRPRQSIHNNPDKVCHFKNASRCHEHRDADIGTTFFHERKATFSRPLHLKSKPKKEVGINGRRHAGAVGWTRTRHVIAAEAKVRVGSGEPRGARHYPPPTFCTYFINHIQSLQNLLCDLSFIHTTNP